MHYEISYQYKRIKNGKSYHKLKMIHCTLIIIERIKIHAGVKYKIRIEIINYKKISNIR